MHIDTIVVRIEGKTEDGKWLPAKMTRVKTFADSKPDDLIEIPVSYEFYSLYDRHMRKSTATGSIYAAAMRAFRSKEMKGFVQGCHFDFTQFSNLRVVEIPKSDFERLVKRAEEMSPMDPMEEEALLEHGE